MKKEKVFSRIGELTVQFATLEHRLQHLLEILVGKENIVVGPVFIHTLNLTALLRRIKIVADYKIGEDKLLLRDLGRVLRKIDAIREERNLLIHGDWQIDDVRPFPIKVRDFKMRQDRGIWRELTQTSISEKKLARLSRRLKGLAQEVDNLTRRVDDLQAVASHVEEYA